MEVADQLAGACPTRAATDADRVDGVLPRAVATPASTEQTAAVLRRCHDLGLAVVVRGHGSKLTWGRPPERVDVVLETTGMSALVEHARGDLVATAGAGMPLATLRSALAEGGHQLVVDDLVSGDARPGSTLGGAMAVNLAGPRRVWAGAMRDLVIGVRLVRADGTVARAGGKVVKNVAGYDLAKLLAGSYGTLAVITEVTVRLHPVPEASRWVVSRVAPDRLPPVLADVLHSQLAPHAVEVAAGPDDAAPRLAVLLGGTRPGVDARVRRLAARLSEVGGGPVEVLDPGAPAPWPLLPVGPGGTGRPTLVRTTARLSGIPQLVREATSRGLTVTGSAGVGVLHAALPPDRGIGEVVATVGSLREASTRLGGSTVVLDAAPAVKAAVDSWGPVPAVDLMRRVKAEFDPGRLLAPGRFVGGI